MKIITNFSDKPISQIRWWAWAASILPMCSLGAIFFIWLFGTKSIFDMFMVFASFAFFTSLVVWWWWVTWILSIYIKKSSIVQNEIKHVVEDIGFLKDNFQKLFKK